MDVVGRDGVVRLSKSVGGGVTMNQKVKVATSKIRIGFWLMMRGIQPNQVYIMHGFAIFTRGMAELLGVR